MRDSKLKPSNGNGKELPVYNLQGKRVGGISLDSNVWDGPVNLKLLSQAVAMYRTNQRAGTASTKTRSEVRGGGKKPWRQKHTGRARAGSTRSPLWRHGGIAFGPRPRSFYYRLPQAARRRALLESLKGKLQDAELMVIDGLSAEAPKTKPFCGLAKAFGVLRKSVIVLENPAQPLVKSLRNLARFELRNAQNLNAFDVLNAQRVLIAKEAVERLQSRMREKAALGGSA